MSEPTSLPPSNLHASRFATEAEAFVPCTPKYLPDSLVITASEVAADVNPANQPSSYALAMIGLVLPPEHLAVLTTKYWGSKGVKLTVGFMESIPADLATRILAHFNAWSAFANVSFALTQTDPQVRVTRNQEGYWSYLGTDILSIPRNQPTMCLQGFTMQTPESEFVRVVRHEVGHTLGFPHEHMRRQLVERIDPQLAIAYFRQTQGWSASMVQQQVLTPLDERSIMGTPNADQTSIMCYSLPSSITRDRMPIVGGKDFTDDDRAFAAKLYPKATDPAPPPKPPEPPAPPVAPSGDAAFFLDFTKRFVGLKLPSGWTAGKASEPGASMSSNTVYLTLAAELEGALPADGIPLAAAAGPLGGSIGSVLKLIAALKSGNAKEIITAVRDVCNAALDLIGSAPVGGDGTISFALGDRLKGLDWSKVLAVVGKLLPLILGAAS